MSADDTAPEAPVLKVGDREFRAVTPPTWLVMKMMAAYTSGDDGRAFGAMYDFLKAVVAPEEWPAFEEHVAAIDAKFSDLDNAIGDFMAALAGRGNVSEESSTPSSDGSSNPGTPPTRRVVSLSQGTVEAEPFEGPVGHPFTFDGPQSSTA